jgi:hypothetical protein
MQNNLTDSSLNIDSFLKKTIKRQKSVRYELLRSKSLINQAELQKNSIQYPFIDTGNQIDRSKPTLVRIVTTPTKNLKKINFKQNDDLFDDEVNESF